MSRKRKKSGLSTDAWIAKPDNHRGEGRRVVQRRVAKHYRQRSEQGYSWYDWINFDTYIAGVIANAVRDFRLKGIGYPAGMEPEEWNDILRKIEGPLRAWSEDKFENGTVAKYEEVKNALRLFADHFGSFWD